MEFHNDQHKRGNWVLGTEHGFGMRSGDSVRVGSVQNSKDTGEIDTMSDGGIAGAIAAFTTAVILTIIKLRSKWSSAEKQVSFDKDSVAWQADRQKELDEIRKEREKMWEQRVKDAQRIAQLESENLFLQHKIGTLETRMARLEMEAKHRGEP